MKKSILILLYFTVLPILWSNIQLTPVFALSDSDPFISGIGYYKQKQYKKAVDALSKVIKDEPENIDAFRVRGSSLMKLGKYDHAIKDFQKAVDLAPDQNGVYSDLGTAWYYNKNYEKALDNYNLEIENGHRNHLVFFNRALCFKKLGEVEKALKDIHTALEIKPDFYLGLCYKGNLFSLKKKYAKAAEAYKAAIKIDAENPYAKEKLDLIKDKIPESGPADNSSAWAVQSGAFRNRDNAQRMRTRLVNEGFDTRLLAIEDKEGMAWYLVRSGKYQSKNTALQAVEALKKLGVQSVVRPAGSW